MLDLVCFSVHIVYKEKGEKIARLDSQLTGRKVVTAWRNT
jgi:hypothetical protein